MTDELRIKAIKILMNSDLTADEIADVHEVMCMTGAIEFLQKAKAICKTYPWCSKCPFCGNCINDVENITDEADLVRKVMNYQIEEVSDAERNYERYKEGAVKDE